MATTSATYTSQFLRNYVAVAVVAAAVLYILFSVMGLQMDNSILRGAVIGGSVGAMLVPFQNVARSYLENEGQMMPSGEAWKKSALWAVMALGIHIALVVVLFVLGWQTPGVPPADQGMFVGVLLALCLVLQIPIFRLFLWSAFRAAEARKRKLEGS